MHPFDIFSPFSPRQVMVLSGVVVGVYLLLSVVGKVVSKNKSVAAPAKETTSDASNNVEGKHAAADKNAKVQVDHETSTGHGIDVSKQALSGLTTSVAQVVRAVGGVFLLDGLPFIPRKGEQTSTCKKIAQQFGDFFTMLFLAGGPVAFIFLYSGDRGDTNSKKKVYALMGGGLLMPYGILFLFSILKLLLPNLRAIDHLWRCSARVLRISIIGFALFFGGYYIGFSVIGIVLFVILCLILFVPMALLLTVLRGLTGKKKIDGEQQKGIVADEGDVEEVEASPVPDLEDAEVEAWLSELAETRDFPTWVQNGAATAWGKTLEKFQSMWTDLQQKLKTNLIAKAVDIYCRQVQPAEMEIQISEQNEEVEDAARAKRATVAWLLVHDKKGRLQKLEKVVDTFARYVDAAYAVLDTVARTWANMVQAFGVVLHKLQVVAKKLLPAAGGFSDKVAEKIAKTGHGVRQKVVAKRVSSVDSLLSAVQQDLALVTIDLSLAAGAGKDGGSTSKPAALRRVVAGLHISETALQQVLRLAVQDLSASSQQTMQQESISKAKDLFASLKTTSVHLKKQAQTALQLLTVVAGGAGPSSESQQAKLLAQAALAKLAGPDATAKLMAEYENLKNFLKASDLFGDAGEDEEEDDTSLLSLAKTAALGEEPLTTRMLNAVLASHQGFARIYASSVNLMGLLEEEKDYLEELKTMLRRDRVVLGRARALKLKALDETCETLSAGVQEEYSVNFEQQLLTGQAIQDELASLFGCVFRLPANLQFPVALSAPELLENLGDGFSKPNFPKNFVPAWRLPPASGADAVLRFFGGILKVFLLSLAEMFKFSVDVLLVIASISAAYTMNLWPAAFQLPQIHLKMDNIFEGLEITGFGGLVSWFLQVLDLFMVEISIGFSFGGSRAACSMGLVLFAAGVIFAVALVVTQIIGGDMLGLLVAAKQRLLIKDRMITSAASAGGGKNEEAKRKAAKVTAGVASNLVKVSQGGIFFLLQAVLIVACQYTFFLMHQILADPEQPLEYSNSRTAY